MEIDRISTITMVIAIIYFSKVISAPMISFCLYPHPIVQVFIGDPHLYSIHAACSISVQ